MSKHVQRREHDAASSSDRRSLSTSAVNRDVVRNLDGVQAYFARATRGLEWVTAAETEFISHAKVTEIAHRLVRFSAPNDPQVLAELRTADDIFVEVALMCGIAATRDALQKIAEAIDRVFAYTTNFPKAESFEVVASFIGRRNYSRFDIEDVIGWAITERIGGTYRSRRVGGDPTVDRSWRAHLWDDRMVIGWRLFDRPLHRRDYRRIAVPGALHPPVAGAISLLAGVSSRDRVFDPCCGSGTLLIEASRRSSVAGIVGMDIAAARVAIALRNAKSAGVPLIGLTGDAADIPLGDACIDLCVANLPWGKQVKATAQLATNPQALWPELRRLLSDRGRAVFLLDQQQAPPDWQCFGFHLNLKLSIATAGRWISLYLVSVNEKRWLWPHDELGQALQKWSTATNE